MNTDDHTIATAAHCFGGHISRGLLKRARNALARRSAASQVIARREVFARIEAVLPLWRMNAETWQEVSAILDKCHLWADIGDRTDYYHASRVWECLPKVEALRAFVTRYAGKRLQKNQLPQIHLRSPEETTALPRKGTA